MRPGGFRFPTSYECKFPTGLQATCDVTNLAHGFTDFNEINKFCLWIFRVYFYWVYSF